MRWFVALAVLMVAAVAASAQQGASEISGAYPGFSLKFHSRTDTAGGIAISSIEGRGDQGAKERFGVMIRAASPASPIVEIMNDKGGVLKVITVGDLLGASTDGTVRPISSGIVVPGRYARSVYDITLQGGKSVRLIVKALATGELNNKALPHPLLVTYALSGEPGRKLALKIMLPIEGAVETSPSGFAVVAKRSPAALAAVVFPAPQKVDAASNIVSITSQPMPLDGEEEETAMLWMRIDGMSGSSASAARDLALQTLKGAESAAGGPNIIVVSAVDKPNVNPADTVSMTLICVNIGSQNAAGVMLKNPVPSGTAYLTNSAEGDDMEIGFDHGKTVDGSPAEISAVRWKMNGALKPGEDRLASFKTIVR